MNERINEWMDTELRKAPKDEQTNETSKNEKINE